MQTDPIEFTLPAFREIPDVGLYLDQTVKYVNRVVEPIGVQPLTPSMVSNYVKKHYISNPVQKQYSPEQLAGLIVIAVSKTVLSMEDLAMLVQPAVLHGRPVSEIYDTYCADLREALAETFGPVGEETSVRIRREPDAMHSLNIAVANVLLVKTYLMELRSAAEKA